MCSLGVQVLVDVLGIEDKYRHQYKSWFEILIQYK